MFAKVVIFCAAVAAVHSNAILSTGVSSSSRQQDGVGNYAFGYDIVDGLGASNARSEVGDAHGNKKGAYTITDIDGRARRVDYVADALGFRVAVKTNEPGTALSAPAAAVIASPYAAPVAPVAINHAAPVAYAGHGLVGAAPLAVAGHGLYGAALAGHGLAPVASYSTVIGHGLGYGGLYGAGLYGKALIH